MATLAELQDALTNADKAGDTAAARQLADAIVAMNKTPIPKPAAYDQGKQAPGWQQGLASVMQGPTFGFADEIGGALGGAYDTLRRGGSLSENYAANRDFLRGAADNQAEVNPWTTGITRALASAPTMLLGGAAPAAAKATMLGQAGRAGATGAATGALSGAGQSTATDIAGTGMDAVKGGALGGLLGAAAQPVVMGMGSAGGNIASRFSESVAGRYAKEKVAEAFARDARGSAVQQNPTAPLTQAVTRLDKLGGEARVVDAGGQNTRQLLDTLTMLPGRTKDATEAAIRSRQSTRGGRLADSAAENLGTGGQRMAPNIEGWITQREQQAGPLYARLQRMQVQPDGDLVSLVGAAENLGAHRIAANIAEARRQPYTLADASNGWAMRDLDHLKQGLDTMIASKVDRVNGGYTPEGAALIKLKSDLTAKLDDMTGGFYAQARDAFAGPSALMDAARAGRASLSRDDVGIQQAMAGLGASELDAFKLGAFEALRTKVGKEGGQTEILKMWKEPATQEKLKALFGDERAYRKFAADVAKEARMKGLDGVGRGSQTAARTYGAGDLDFAALSDAAQAVSGTGGVTGMIANLTRAWNRVQTPEPVRDAMGGLLLQQGQQGRTGLLSMEETMRKVNEDRQRRAAGLGVGAGYAGGLLHGVLVP